jgi:hypothetical protein
MVVMQAKRLSAHLAAGATRAGRAAEKLRVLMCQRASAIKQMLVVDTEAEQATSQVGGINKERGALRLDWGKAGGVR